MSTNLKDLKVTADENGTIIDLEYTKSYHTTPKTWFQTPTILYSCDTLCPQNFYIHLERNWSTSRHLEEKHSITYIDLINIEELVQKGSCLFCKRTDTPRSNLMSAVKDYIPLYNHHVKIFEGLSNAVHTHFPPMTIRPVIENVPEEEIDRLTTDIDELRIARAIEHFHRTEDSDCN